MLSDRVKKLDPYVPGEQPQDKKYIKLNTNENPYPAHNDIMSVLASINIEKLRLYPDPESLLLKKELSRYYGVPTKNIFVSNGSDEALSLIFYTFFNKSVLFPELSYSFYPVYCNFYDIQYQSIPLNDDFSIKFEKISDIKDYDGIIFPNPNAPTAIFESIETIEGLIKSNNDKIIVVDEAYIDFGGDSALSLIDKYENLLVVRTFSKFASLAGIRLGFVFGHEKLIKYLNFAKNSFNSYPIDLITQRIGCDAIKHMDHYIKNCEKVISTRKKLLNFLRENEWFVTDSMANFVFCSKSGIKGEYIYNYLKDNGILVRYFSSIPDFVRISIGTDEEVNKLISFLKKI